MLHRFLKKFYQDGEIYLRLKIRPGASVNAVKKILEDKDGEIIKIDIAAPALRGKANQELMNFLAEKFDINKRSIKIISGAGDRLKLVKIVK